MGELGPGDVRDNWDRRTAHYAVAIQLAKQVLRNSSRELRVGTDTAWAFLIRTPEQVEAGVRAVLREGLKDICSATKEARKTLGADTSFEPDLRFGHDRAVGDVKYSIDVGTWRRSDLYQLAAFSRAFECKQALLVNFTNAS